ncbi:MAG: HD domain-containing protein [Chloroflexi bacterium]|nr:HD domain-containing protein [Chloroflexota bacterium]
MSVPAVQRFRQGLADLFAFALPVDRELAARHLTPELLALFDRLQRGEQLHSLNVLRDVLAQGPTPRELAVAALLHDAGKSLYPLRTWQRTYAVLLRRIFPALARRWQDGDPRRLWQRPFVVTEHHPAWSAELLAAAGAPEGAVWLAAYHADDPGRWAGHPLVELLRRLQQADDAN